MARGGSAALGRAAAERIGACRATPRAGGERRGGGWATVGPRVAARRRVGVGRRCARSEDSEPSQPAKEATVEEAEVPSQLEFPLRQNAFELAPGNTASVGSTKRSTLRGSTLSCGVKTATTRYDLPSPQVAVRNLVEQANFAHLCTIMSNMHHRRAGYPFGTLVGFTTDGAGFPIFSLSPLAIPTRNILEDSRCSLVVQMPGWTGLSNARVTIFGDVYQLPADMHQKARELFLSRNNKQENFVTGNTLYFRMHHIKDIFFVGGFGTVQWIDVTDYMSCQPDDIVVNNTHETLQMLNEHYAESLQRAFSSNEYPVDDAAIISVDALGADVRVRSGVDFGVVRIGFDMKVRSFEDASSAVNKVITQAQIVCQE